MASAPVQDGARHWVAAPGSEQALTFAPSQKPSQALPSAAQGVRVPCGAPVTGTQVPTLPISSQASHWPPQPALQQTPSAQKPDEHSLGTVHGLPSGS